MELDTLTAISPVDGRYRSRTADLAPYFSEFGLIRYRIRVEVEYFIALSHEDLNGMPRLSDDEAAELRKLYTDFGPEQAQRVKEIEAVTNHDVKAVEYYIKEHLERIGGNALAAQEFVHFGLTSQDINNTATPLALKEAVEVLLLPAWSGLVDKLHDLAHRWDDIAMLARTHGQPASPTRLGKEIRVFVVRLQKQIDDLAALTYPAKFGGATGNFNAHVVAYGDRDWHAFGDRFVNEVLGLSRSFPTTQIEHYDGLAAIFDNIRRLNTVLIDLCVDVWLYVSQEYFRQKAVAHEVGSSAMPHKVNPIDFENAEGNLGVAGALLEFLSRSLPISRLQRDLTDSTVLRNVGNALAHSLIAIRSVEKGLGKLQVNENKIRMDLEENWAVTAEALQTILRREGYPKPYEKLKDLTRGKARISEADIKEFIEGLDVSEAIKAEMRKVSPWTFTGM